MALEQHAFDILRTLAPCRLLSLGVPDLLLSEEYDTKRADNEDGLQRWHRWRYPIYETDALFREFGIEATYLDNQAHRGNEVVADLNEPLEVAYGLVGGGKGSHFAEKLFDVVLDPGTLEHCFNIGQAFKNVRNLCRPGGHILHINPMSMFNHGFWNLNPCAYVDFYGDHGDEIVSKKIIGGTLEERLIYRWHDWQRFGADNSMLCEVLIKRGDTPTMSGWPSQVKYDPEKRKKAIAEMKAAVEGRETAMDAG